MRLLLLALLLMPLAAAAQTGAIATGILTGTVLEADGVTAIIGANVRVGGTTLGAATDLDGSYRIIGVPIGAYDITASYVGYPSVTVTGAEINAGSTRRLNFTLSDGGPPIPICGMTLEAPLFTNDAIGQSRTLLGWDIQDMPVNR